MTGWVGWGVRSRFSAGLRTGFSPRLRPEAPTYKPITNAFFRSLNLGPPKVFDPPQDYWSKRFGPRETRDVSRRSGAPPPAESPPLCYSGPLLRE